MKTAVKYRLHRSIAIIVVPILLISTITGVFKANQKWYWEEGYKKKKQSSSFSIVHSLVQIDAIALKIDSITDKRNKFEEIVIRSECKKLFYKLGTTTKEKYLVDALSGDIVSPISTGMASEFATQYVKGKPKIKTCVLLNDYVLRKGKEVKPVYKIEFDNEIHSEIYLDYYNGEIVEDLDDNRAFGIWVMRLHEYDFFNAKRGLAIFVGSIIILLALSGLWIYKSRINSKKANVR